MKSRFMLSLMVLLGLSFLTNNQLDAQSCPAPPPPPDKAEVLGQWEGTYTYEGKTYDLKVEFKEKGENFKGGILSETLVLVNSHIQSMVVTTRWRHRDRRVIG